MAWDWTKDEPVTTVFTEERRQSTASGTVDPAGRSSARRTLHANVHTRHNTGGTAHSPKGRP